MPPEPRTTELPTTIKELWATGWVASNAAEADAQAERMYDLFASRTVGVDRLRVRQADGTYDEELFVEPWPEVVVVGLDTNSGWDGEVLYADWSLRVANPDQLVTTEDGTSYRMGDLETEDGLFTTVPGIGTADGFGPTDRLIYPAATDLVA